MEDCVACRQRISNRISQLQQEQQQKANTSTTTSSSINDLVTGSTPTFIFPKNKREEFTSSDIGGSTTVHCAPNSSFCSAYCEMGVGSGKYMYEVKLLSDGLLQIGWTTSQLDWTTTYGVGDGIHSYGYDGHRVKLWNITSKDYGKPWKRDDVITCCLDLDAGQMIFYQNGECLGVAVENVPRLSKEPYVNDGYVYHPGVSMSNSQACSINLGAAPLEYPVEGYRTLVTPDPMRKIRAEVAMEELLDACAKHSGFHPVQLVAADAFLEYVTPDNESFGVFARLVNAASEAKCLPRIFESLGKVSVPQTESLLMTLITSVKIVPSGVDFSAFPTLLATASLLEAFAMGTWEHMSTQVLAFMLEVFQMDIPDRPSTPWSTAASPEAGLAELQKLWKVSEANTAFRTECVRKLLKGERGVTFLSTILTQIQEPASLHLYMVTLLRIAREDYKMGRADLFPDWAIASVTPIADRILRLGGGFTHLSSTYPESVSVAPADFSLNRIFFVDAMTSLIEATKALRFGRTETPAWMDACRTSLMYCPAYFEDLRYGCGLLLNAISDFADKDLFRFIPTSWIVFVVDTFFFFKRIDPNWIEFYQKHADVYVKCVALILTDARVVLPDVDMMTIREVASSLVFEKRFGYKTMIACSSEQQWKDLMLGVVLKFSEKGHALITALSQIFQLTNEFTCMSVPVELAHVELLSKLFKINLNQSPDAPIFDEVFARLWCELVEDETRFTPDMQRNFFVKLLGLATDSLTLASQRKQTSPIPHKLAVMQACMSIMIITGVYALTPGLVMRDARTGVQRLCELLCGYIREMCAENTPVERRWGLDSVYQILMCVTFSEHRNLIVDYLSGAYEWDTKKARYVASNYWLDKSYDLVMDFISDVDDLRMTRGASTHFMECVICDKNEVDTMFLPCKHYSCRGCIDRHLENHKECFICRRIIESLTPYQPGAAATGGDGGTGEEENAGKSE